MLGIETINVKEYETTKKLLEMVPGGIDCSLQAAGFSYSKSLFYKNECSLHSTISVNILTEIITCNRKSGTISKTGDYNNAVNHIPVALIMDKNLWITGGHSHTQKSWKMCLDKVCLGEIDPRFVVSHYIPINHLFDYYHQLVDKESGALKCFIQLQN